MAMQLERAMQQSAAQQQQAMQMQLQLQLLQQQQQQQPPPPPRSSPFDPQVRRLAHCVLLLLVRSDDAARSTCSVEKANARHAFILHTRDKPCVAQVSAAH